MAIESFSFRYKLVETVERFLSIQWPAQVRHADFFAEIIGSLAGHREEGASLYPVVFVCASIDDILQGLGGKDPIEIGSGPVTRQLVQQTLKQCAPLAERRQWAIYISIGQESGQPARYGVFRTENSPLSPTTFGSLRALDRQDICLIGLLQIGENVIEVRSAHGDGLHLYLSGARMGTKHPQQTIKAFIRALSRETPAALKQPLQDFYYRVFTELTRDVHGSLIAVLPVTGARMDIFSDAVILAEPLSIPAAIESYARNPGVEEIAGLYSRASLIRGMLGCDGITLFRSDGVLLGYNAFIQPTRAMRQALGGARRRAFEALAGHVGHGVNLAVYRSQDGALDYIGVPDKPEA